MSISPPPQHNVLHHSLCHSWGTHLHASYARFARRDETFYDRPDLPDGQGVFPTPAGVSWEGWARSEDDHWFRFLPPAVTLPDQGWKIHLSATPATAATVLEIASRYCNAARLAFKHLRTSDHLFASLAKDADRSGAGKFVTIYPQDTQALESTLRELDPLVRDLTAAYVLSDLRWESGPLYVRYGAFTARFIDHHGTRVPAVENLTSGELVPDIREPSFVIPPWVSLPSFLEEQLAALQTSSAVTPLPTIVGALHHSNAGGVYSCVVEGTAAVLKEARPHVGFTPDGRDAVTRLAHESIVLASLPSDFPAPKVLLTVQTHGHLFVALNEISGITLEREVVARNPIGSPNTTEGELAAYREWALAISGRLRDVVRELHANDIAHGDLHPGNVIVDSSGSVSLIDFEMSTPTSDLAVRFGVPGFVAPGRVTAMENDAYALAAIELYLFLPLVSLVGLSETKADELARAATSIFELPATWSDGVTTGFSAGAKPLASSSAAASRVGFPSRVRVDEQPDDVYDQLLSTLLADRESRSDRLWPGDPRQFDQPSWSLEHGALGVAVALDAAGHPPDPLVKTWVETRLLEGARHAPLGLMNGLSGALRATRALGWDIIADEILHHVIAFDPSKTSSDLQSGLAGLGLALLPEVKRSEAAGAALEQITTELERRLLSTPGPTKVGPRRGGLFGGMSGVALFALEMHDRTGDDRFRKLARSAIEWDIGSLVESSDGTLLVNEGWRGLPYIGHGSAGIGLAIARYLLVDVDATLESILSRIVRASRVRFVAQAGWLQGRAGLISFLTELRNLGYRSDENDEAVAAHVDLLQLHLLHSPAGVRVVGDGLLRASCDFATGAAGVIEALARHRALVSGQHPLPPSVAPIFVRQPVWGRASTGGGEKHGVPPLSANAGTGRF